MDLSFNDLKNRDVVNVNDGRCLGQIKDIVLAFPAGVLTGIVVPGKKVCFLLKWIKSSKDLFIPRKNIQKIGNDVILVSLASSVAPATKNNCCQNGSVTINNTDIDIDNYE